MKLLNLLFLTLLILSSCTPKKVNQEILKAHYAADPMVIDGKMDEAAWLSTDSELLDYFFRINDENYRVKTSFRALWKEDTLYFHFVCQDKYITAKETKRDGMPFLDDCAEVFLIPAGNDRKMHFCFEVNILQAINDVLYFDDLLGKGPGVLKAYNPEVEIGVDIDGTVNDNTDIDKGWSMEFAIPGSAFSRVIETSPIAEGEKWCFLAIRQNRDILKEELTDDDRETITNYDIKLGVEAGVHQSNSFGILEFVK